MTDTITLKQAVGIILEGFTLPDAARKILETAYWADVALAQQAEQDEVGINGLTAAETRATMSVAGLSEPTKLTAYERKCFNDWKSP